MFFTKNIVTNTTVMPVLGKNNRLVNEISKRFAKYYRRGIKSANNKKLLGYNLIVPKSFSKFESTFREDLMMMEIKVNKNSSILIPSFYSSTESLETFFELKSKFSLKNIYSIEEGRYKINLDNTDHKKLLESMGSFGDAASAELDVNKEISLGQGENIKNKTKEFLNRHYGKGFEAFASSLLEPDLPGVSGGKKFAGSILRMTPLAPVLRIGRWINRKSNNILKSNLDIISCSNINEMKVKTKKILDKVYSGNNAVRKDELIEHICKLYDPNVNLSDWTRNIEQINAKYLLPEEEEIFRDITQLFSRGLDFGAGYGPVPGSPEEAKTKKFGETPKTEKKGGVFTSGSLRVITPAAGAVKETMRYILLKLTWGKLKQKLEKKYGKKKIYNIEDFDKKIAAKIKRYTDSLEKGSTKEKERMIIFPAMKQTMQAIIPLGVIYGASMMIIGFTSPITQGTEQLVKQGEEKAAVEIGLGTSEERAEKIKEVQSQAEAGKKYVIMFGEGKNLCKDSGFISFIEKNSNQRLTSKQKFEINFISSYCGDNYELLEDSAPNTLRSKLAGNFNKNVEDLGLDEEELKVYNGLKEHFYGGAKNISIGTLNRAIYTNLNFVGQQFFSDDEVSSADRGLTAVASAQAEDATGVNFAEEFVRDVNEFGNMSEEEAQKEAQNQASKNLIQGDGSAEIEESRARLYGLGQAVMNRWEKNMSETDSVAVSVMRELGMLPINVCLSVLSSYEDKIGTPEDESMSKAVGEFLNKKENLNRTEGLLLFLWFSTILKYLFNSDSGLSDRVVEVYNEIILETNIFRAMQVQQGIHVVQMILWASCADDFKSLVKKSNDEQENVEWDQRERQRFNLLRTKLNGIKCKKVVMDTKTLEAAGYDASGAAQFTEVESKGVPKLEFYYTSGAKK